MCRVDSETGADLGAGAGRCQGGVHSGRLRCRLRRVDEQRRRPRRLARRRRRHAGLRVAGERRWRPPHRPRPPRPIGFGDLVFLKFGATIADPGPAPKVTVAPVEPTPRRATRGRADFRPRRGAPGAMAASRSRRAARAGSAAAAAACSTAQFRKHRGGRLLRRWVRRVRARLGTGRTLAVDRHRGAHARQLSPATAAEAAAHRGHPRRRRLRSDSPTRGGSSPGEGPTARQSLLTTVALAAVVAVAAPAGAATVTPPGHCRRPGAALRRRPVSTHPHAVDGGDGSGAHPAPAHPLAPPGRNRDRCARRRDASRRHLLARQLGPELPRLLHRPHRSLCLGRPRPLLVADVNGRFAQRWLPGAGQPTATRSASSIGPLFGGPPRSSRRALPVRAVAGRRRPIRPVRKRGRPQSRDALAAAGSGLPATYAGGGGSIGGGWRWRCGGGADPALAAAAACSTAAAPGPRDGSLGGDVNATALAILALGERLPVPRAGPPAGSPRSQDASGGFGFRPGAPPDVDTTGLAVWAPGSRGGLGTVHVQRRLPALRPGGRRRLSRPCPGGPRTRRAPASPGRAAGSRRGSAVLPSSRDGPARLPRLAGPARRRDRLQPRRQPDPDLDHGAGAARARPAARSCPGRRATQYPPWPATIFDGGPT